MHAALQEAVLAEPQPGEIVFGLIPSDEVVGLWPEIEGLVQSILEKRLLREYEAEDIFQACVDGHMQLWTGLDYGEIGVLIITQMTDFPQTRILYVLFVAGRDGKLSSQWWKAKPIIEDFGRANGCSAVRGYGRPGWKRKYPDQWDYEIVHTVWGKSL